MKTILSGKLTAKKEVVKKAPVMVKDTSKVKVISSIKFDNYITNISSLTQINGKSDAVVDFLRNMYSLSSDISFIDITDKEDSVTVIPANRIYKTFKGEEKDIIKREFDNYLTTEKELGGVHQFIKGYSGVWNNGRIEIKIGKLVKKLNEKFTDKQIEEFVNKYKAIYRTRHNISLSLVSGEAIKHWYNQEKYAHTPDDKSKQGLGTLGKSCMRYGSDYFDIYAHNPEVCSMLILQPNEDKNKLIGRALVWKLMDGSTYMDRIYTHFDSDYYLFENYAKERNWLTHKDFTTGSKKAKTMRVQLKTATFKHYPFMDTFFILHVANRILSPNLPTNREERAGHIQIRNTNGGHEIIK